MATDALAPAATPAELALAVVRARPQRLAFALMLALFAAAGAVALWSFVWPNEDPWVNLGSIEDFPPGTVTPVGYPDEPLVFHIVRLDDGELLALLARDPHLGCAVPYRPDFVWDGRPGWFRNPCHGETYDMAGRRVFGPSPRDLDRLAVEVRNGAVYVNPTAITPGARQPPGGDDFQTGGTLLPPRRY